MCEFLGHLIEPFEKFLVAHLIRYRLLHNEGYRSARLQNRTFHFIQTAEALPMGYCFQFLARKQLLSQLLFVDFSILDQSARRALDRPVQIFVAVQESHHEVVDQQQRRGANDAAGHGVVVADDGVLHRVREREQHHQVERIQLRQFAFPARRNPITRKK